MSTTDQPALPLLWEPVPDRWESSPLAKFQRMVNRKYKLNLKTYEELHTWSIENVTQFWSEFFSFSAIRTFTPPSDIVLESRPGTTQKGPLKPIDLPVWFPGTTLNYAENILYPIHPSNGTACDPATPRSWPHEDADALIEVPESWSPSSSSSSQQQQLRKTSWGALRRRVAALAAALRAKGIKREDRIAHISSNTSPPIVTFLAALSIGAIWSGLATDAGEDAIYRRLEQTQPRIIFADDTARYNGKRIDISERIAKVAESLKKNAKLVEEGGAEFEVVTIRNTEFEPVPWKAKGIKNRTYEEFLSAYAIDEEKPPRLQFEALPFSAPSVIVFSSGTTSEPKCITHTHGGMVIASKLSGLIEIDCRPGERQLTITTLNWIMWYHQMNSLISGGVAVLLSGGPLYPDPLHLPKIIGTDGLNLTHFVCSPRWLSEVEKAANAAKIHPREAFKLHNLKYVFTTGAPLSLANASFLYDRFVPREAQLGNNSGGTDMGGVLIGSMPNVKVYGNSLGAKILGSDIRILDQHTGEDIEHTGEPGELAVVAPFPNQPSRFWGPKGQEKELLQKYYESYYLRWDSGPGKGVWVQGDFVYRTKEGAYAITGRSDAILNPSGVRFGSGDVYAVVDKLSHVDSTICVGQRRPGKDDDEKVLLFIKTQGGAKLTQDQKDDISKKIRVAYSARHVPHHIFQVKDIPVTNNLKKIELAVKRIVCGQLDFKPSSTTLNPECLEEYKQYYEIEKVVNKAKL